MEKPNSSLTEVAFSNEVVSHTNVEVNSIYDVASLKTIPRIDPSQYLSFDMMPGPTSVRFCAKLWSIIPLTQNQEQSIKDTLGADYLYGYLNWYNNIPLFKRMARDYGAVVRIQGPFGGDFVVMLLMDDAINLTQTDGPYPIRSCLHSLQQFRLKNKQYQHAGPFLNCGSEWKKMRTLIEETLHNIVPHQGTIVRNACKEFVQRIAHIRNRRDEVPLTFESEIYKWSLECMWGLFFNKRCGFLKTGGLSESSEPAGILSATTGVIAAIRRCEFGVLVWKLVGTPNWKNLVKHADLLDSAIKKNVCKAQESLRQMKQNEKGVTPENASFLEMLLLKEGVSPESVLTTLLEMIIIGVNSLTHAVSFLLYHLSCNPNVQRKLYKEISTEQDLNKMQFMKVCINESLRLKQPIPLLNRVLTNNTVIRNYYVPKGTTIVITPQLYGIKQEYFENALRFKPDRWLHDEMKLNGYPLSSLPYGLGGRACFARSLVEMQLSSLMSEIIRKYRVEYHYGEINSTNTMLAAPNRSLRFTFIDRE
ncbi:hypothetical protein RI129_007536 [Pyrocoelia pectoralis]|uniref:Cytochrome P450 n=1 Tax=Pyrocoelia pectoralis TaxID=417401 RepID=A0AAN7VDS7_9COLE